MKYGYRRVSSTGQARNGTSLKEQLEKLLAEGVPGENVYTDVYTGTKMDRPEMDKLLAVLQPGDELVVCKLDRFARTAAEGSVIVRDLVARGIRVHVLNMGVADNTPMGKLMVTMLLAFAEFERDMIYERTQAGKAYRRENDPEYKEGRPRVEVDPAELAGLIAQQQAGIISAAEAAEALGVSRRKYYNLLREVGDVG